MFGATVLYSAGGGGFDPWAKTHLLRYVVFLVMAILLSRVRKDIFQQARLPNLHSYRGAAGAGRGDRRNRRRQPALAQPGLHDAATIRIDEAGDRARPRPLLWQPAPLDDRVVARLGTCRGTTGATGGARHAPARLGHRASDYVRRHGRGLSRRRSAALVSGERALQPPSRRPSRSSPCSTITSAIACWCS